LNLLKPLNIRKH